MKRPVQITFRDMKREPTLERLVVHKVAWLERYCHRITGCRVLVEAPHRHHRNGRPYHVRVDMTIPGSDLVVRRDAGQSGRHRSVRIAIHDAFDAARRILQDAVRRRRGEIKRHSVLDRSAVAARP
jgi:ribosome-associated translation inhibitor RaiA